MLYECVNWYDFYSQVIYDSFSPARNANFNVEIKHILCIFIPYGY